MGYKLPKASMHDQDEEPAEEAEAPLPASQPVVEPGEILLKRKQVARKLGVSEHSVYKMGKRGNLPKPVLIGGRWVRYKLSDIDAFIEAGCIMPGD